MLLALSDMLSQAGIILTVSSNDIYIPSHKIVECLGKDIIFTADPTGTRISGTTYMHKSLEPISGLSTKLV